MKKIKNITIIGAGNVGSHLAKTFFKNGFGINQIYSRSLPRANAIAKLVGAHPINSIEHLSAKVDILIIAINDDAIAEVAKNIPFRSIPTVHTSGSVPMDLFAPLGYSNYGIFYPLQSFNEDKKINLKKVPFCIEANSEKNLEAFVVFAENISNLVYKIDSSQRKTLHLAAVFANNFSNYMYQVAKEITDKNKLPFDILKPLIYETAKKMKTLAPKDAQTGPAKRNDTKTMEKHLELLKDSPELRDLYQDISKLIIKSNNSLQ